MDFSKVKLVVTDMDGTLLNDQGIVSSKFFNQFPKLKALNVHFVAASGRQFQSIANKLNPIKDQISIIAENGGIMQCNNQIDVLLKLSRQNVLKSVETLRTAENCYTVLCGAKSAYIETKDAFFIDKFKEYYNAYEIVDDLTTIEDDDILKIAVYHAESSEKFILPHTKHLANELELTVSSQNWLDISHPEANKGYALKKLQKKMGVTKEETLVFGDYNNDIEMLQLADFSYAMENAHPNVKQTARFVTKSNNEDGVEIILDELIYQK